MQIVFKKVQDLKNYKNNARTHSKEQIEEIMNSIKTYGFLDPVEIDENNVLISGHARVEAAKKMGLKEVPTVTHNHLSETERKGYILAANKLATKAAWDEQLLAEEFQELLNTDFDLNLTGFDQKEIDELLSSYEKNNLDQEKLDEVPELKKEAKTVRGDIWMLGDHVLMCGDSTQIDDVDKLMDGKKADLIFTDPPYGMSYGGEKATGSTKKGDKKKGYGLILNDDKTGSDLVNLVYDALSNAKLVSKQNAAAYVCFTWRTWEAFEQAFLKADFKISSCIVWNKKSIGMYGIHYRPQHEFIFYSKGDIWNGERNKSDVWELSRGNVQNYVHPTQKPVELIEMAIENSSNNKQIVLDVFGGSGSTLIACENTNRKCYTMELSENYCDVIIERWQKITSKKAVLKKTGAFFDEQ